MYLIWHMQEAPIPVKHGPPEMRHRIVGERSDDLPVRSIEVLMHRRVTLSQWVLQRASAPYWRLYWPLTGGASIIHEGRRTALLPGRMYLIPPHTAFDSHAAKTFSKWYIHFTLRGSGRPPAPGVHAVSVTPRLKTLLAQTCNKSAGSDSALSFRVIELIAAVLSTSPARLWTAPPADRRMEDALKHMERDFASKLTLHFLGRQCGLSPRALTKLCVAHTGFAPIRYLTELRLNHCCRLLRHTTLHIEQIAEQCGFANRFYLTRMMRKYRHTTPAAFRNQATRSA